MAICICICMCVCICIYICICYVYVYVCVYVYVYFKGSIIVIIFCRFHHVVLYHAKNRYRYYHQPQQILLVPSTHAACFGRTDSHQALNTCYLKHKKSMHFYFEF